MSSEDRINTVETDTGVRLPFGFEPDEQGMIHWVYHKKLWRTVYLPVRAALFCLYFGIVAVSYSFIVTKNVDASLMIAGVMIGTAVVSFLIWGVTVLVMGGEQCLKMAMDEERVTSAQLPRASRWARTLSDAAMPYGIMSNDMRIVIAALNRVCDRDKTSMFGDVTKISVNTKREYVSVKTGMTENKIYARPEQLDFVVDFIVQRCPKAKIKRK